MRPFIRTTTLLLSVFIWTHAALQAQRAAPMPVIFDSDMGPDYDDVGAITLLHAYADRGDATILATMASTKYEGVAAVFDVLNTYFEKPDIPIGVPKAEALELRDEQGWTKALIAKYPHDLKTNADAPDTIGLYRQLLAQQPEDSVTIITVGFLTNIANLLRSPPDQHSTLTGKDLVEKKVKKLVSMAGAFPSGKEFNVYRDAAASKYAFEHWPKPMLFSGFEIGNKIKSGLPLIRNGAIRNSPVKEVFSISIPLDKEDSEGRMSWDQTAVLVAIKGPEPLYTLQPGTIVVADDGSNSWKREGTKQHYLVEKAPVSEVQQLINDLMMHQPGQR